MDREEPDRPAGGERIPRYQDVAAFLADLDPAQRVIVERLRAPVLGSHPGLIEHIKFEALGVEAVDPRSTTTLEHELKETQAWAS